MVTTSSPQSKTNPNGTATEKTTYWVETIVRWTRGATIGIRLEPSAESGKILSHIHRGDLIQVQTDFKRGHWVPCRAGHITGWLNTKDVKLIRTGASPITDAVYVAIPSATKTSTHSKKRKQRTNLIQRLIKFFK
ncbi:MAG: hypothetical protein Q9P44_07130 [Anaerolineae bacterium]|nr:hypothetical protein [Anaerolineae bacterium]